MQGDAEILQEQQTESHEADGRDGFRAGERCPPSLRGARGGWPYGLSAAAEREHSRPVHRENSVHWERKGLPCSAARVARAPRDRPHSPRGTLVALPVRMGRGKDAHCPRVQQHSVAQTALEGLARQ
ncbi:hypothetical protein HJG60_007749 [Phyllostomus discolor]|uniref:Uncharacterized protein n=1 Tax=Phyllostomus discolor TaxID=89673 RepID=A0A834BN37_9CHIR|nr:hypothetical protein HJG60_007749 [Phyllostomus discolor]